MVDDAESVTIEPRIIENVVHTGARSQMALFFSQVRAAAGFEKWGFRSSVVLVLRSKFLKVSETDEQGIVSPIFSAGRAPFFIEIRLLDRCLQTSCGLSLRGIV